MIVQLQIIIHYHQLVSSFIIKHLAFIKWLNTQESCIAETYVQLDLVQLAKNNEVKTFSNWGKEFSVTFDYIAKKAQATSVEYSILHISGMAIQVVEFSSGGYKIGKIQTSIISFEYFDFRQKSFQFCIPRLKTQQPVLPYLIG